MAKHYIAVLGTGLYEPVIYKAEAFVASREYEFVQFAIMEQHMQELSEANAKVTLFVTDGAKQRNFDNRIYTGGDVMASSRWVSSLKEKVIEGQEKPGFEQQYKTSFPEIADRFEQIWIPDGKTENEIWDIFSSIYDSLEEGDEIIFDITHGFRSIPMLAMAVVNYAKVLKNCSLISMSYGAFEAAETKVVEGKKWKETPIFNLTPYNEIMEWTTAAEVFMKYGNASMMNEVFKKKFLAVPNQEKKYWSSLRKTMGAAENLSLAIQTCRGIDSKNLPPTIKKNVELYSIKKAVEIYSDSIENTQDTTLNNVKALIPLLEKTNDVFSVFEKNTNYEIGLAVVEWSIKNHMVQQGYTALEESIKTFLCDYYGMDELEQNCRDAVAGTSAVALQLGIQSYKKLDTLWDRIDYYGSLREQHFWKFANVTDQKAEIYHKKCREIILTLPLDMAQEIACIKDERNDINHFGMRKTALKSSDFEKKLSEHYQNIMRYIDEMKNIKEREEES